MHRHPTRWFERARARRRGRGGALRSMAGAVGAWLVLLAASPASGAGAKGAGAAQDPTPQLTITTATGAPGAEASSLIYISTPQPLKTGAVTLRLEFPAELAAFVKADSYLATSLGVEVRSTAKGQRDGRSAVEVEVAAKPDGAKRKAIPDGMLAYVVYRIAKEARLDQTIPVDVRAVVHTTDDPAREVPAAIVEPATIVVKEDVVFSCFFYMH